MFGRSLHDCSCVQARLFSSTHGKARAHRCRPGPRQAPGNVPTSRWPAVDGSGWRTPQAGSARRMQYSRSARSGPRVTYRPRGQQVAQGIRRFAVGIRALQNQDVAMLEEFLPAMPRGQAAKCVPAQKQKQLVVRGQLGTHQFQGVDSVGRFIALERGRPPPAAVCQLRQGAPFPGAAALTPAAYRGAAAGHWGQAQFIQREGIRDFQGTAQMADMHGVKGAAEQPDAFTHQARTCPSPNTTYFSLVRPSRPTGPRAWSLSVEIPISAPRPYSKPSAKRVRR